MKKYIFISTVVLSLALIGMVSYHILAVPPTLPTPSLKERARAYDLELGNFAIHNLIKERAYKNILTSQFSLATIDNTPNWYFTDGGLHPERHTYNFKQMDEVVKFAQQHSMAIQAHHYVWGEEKWLPDWLKNGGYTKEDLTAIMTEHINTVGKKYAGKIKQWTVVNEAFSRGQHINGLNDWWADATGDRQYIDVAFTVARQADPSSELILNDFGNEIKNSVSDEMYTYVEEALQRGIPIDGLGMQMHIDGNNPPSKDAVIENMKRFGELGIDVYVTEFDVTMNGVQGSADEKDSKQAAVYYDMLRACIESPYCHSFALLGITDKETWYNYMNVNDPRPLPFDKAYNPKPAFYAMHQALSE